VFCQPEWRRVRTKPIIIQGKYLIEDCVMRSITSLLSCFVSYYVCQVWVHPMANLMLFGMDHHSLFLIERQEDL